MAKAKLLGVLTPPKGATFVAVHSVDDAGALGQKLSIQADGRIFDTWPISEVTREWIVATFGVGTYRLQYLGTEAGKKKRFGTSGAVVIDDEPAGEPVEVAPVHPPAPAPPAPPAPLAASPGAMPVGQSMGDGFAMLNLYRTIESEVRARESAEYQARTERDRAFFSVMLQMAQGGRLPPVDVARAQRIADGEEEEEEDPVVEGVKAFARELGPALKDIAGQYFASKMGGGGGAAGGAT
jgi:hypothetical protein